MRLRLSTLVHAVGCVGVGVSAACGHPSPGHEAVTPEMAVRLGPDQADTSVEFVSDSVREIVVKNPMDRAVRVMEISVYDCTNVRAGCGSSVIPIDIAPHQSARVRTVRRGLSYADWHWRYLVRTRWTPPPDAEVVEATVPAGAGNFLSGTVALDWDSFRPIGRGRVLQPYETINVAQRLTLFLEEIRHPGGTSTFRVSGEIYKGDTASGRISARRVDWWPLTIADSAGVARLRHEAQRAVAAIGMSYNEFRDSVLRRGPAGTVATGGIQLSPVAMGSTSIGATQPRTQDLGSGRSTACRAQGHPVEAPLVVGLTIDPGCAMPDTSMRMHYNAYIVTAPTAPHVGARVATCSAYTRDLPTGWERVAWYTDPTVCPVDGVGIDSAQPNILLLQRVR